LLLALERRLCNAYYLHLHLHSSLHIHLAGSLLPWTHLSSPLGITVVLACYFEDYVAFKASNVDRKSGTGVDWHLTCPHLRSRPIAPNPVYPFELHLPLVPLPIVPNLCSHLSQFSGQILIRHCAGPQACHRLSVRLHRSWCAGKTHGAHT
jgi:hypothetical protein